MTKKKGIFTLAGMILALIAEGYVAVSGWMPERPAPRQISSRAWTWLAGASSITYEVVGEEEPSAEDMADTIDKLQKRVENYSTQGVGISGGGQTVLYLKSPG